MAIMVVAQAPKSQGPLMEVFVNFCILVLVQGINSHAIPTVGENGILVPYQEVPTTFVQGSFAFLQKYPSFHYFHIFRGARVIELKNELCHDVRLDKTYRVAILVC